MRSQFGRAFSYWEAKKTTTKKKQKKKTVVFCRKNGRKHGGFPICYALIHVSLFSVLVGHFRTRSKGKVLVFRCGRKNGDLPIFIFI